MANWKSHKSLVETRSFLEDFSKTLSARDHALLGGDIVIFPSFVSLPIVSALCQQWKWPIQFGAQAVSAWEQGAHTGEVSADMLADVGVRYVLIGHSERRKDQGENGPITEQKIRRCQAAKLIPVLCIGETLEQRRNMRTDHVLRQQLNDAFAGLDGADRLGDFIIAYEPVWAIGTGLVPTEEQLRDTALSIRRVLKRLFCDPRTGATNRADSLPLLYGGSVKRGNADKIMALSCYQGLLIGGASLDPKHLSDIVSVAVN